MLNIKKLIVATCTFLFAGSALAVPTLSISDGTSTVIVVDNGAGDTSGTAGRVNTGEIAIGGFFITVSTGITKPFPGSENSMSLDIEASSTGPSSTLTVMFSETGFDTLPLDMFHTAVSSTSGASHSVTFDTFLDDGDALFATTTSLGSFATSTSGFGDSNVADPSFSGTFSLTSVITVTHSGPGTTNADLELSAVPEPTTVALLGLALFGFGMTFRRRRQVIA